MLSFDNIKHLTRSFLKEACEYLGMDHSGIGIVYMPMPVHMRLIMLLRDADVIAVDKGMLADIARRDCYTVLRHDVYRAARELYQRQCHKSDGKIQDEKEEAADAEAFSYALCFLYGLSIVIPHQFESDLVPRIERILCDEFNEDCILYKIADTQFPGEFRYRARKADEAHDKELKRLNVIRPVIVSKSTVEGDKGSETNPFDNVIKACEYIQKEEAKAYSDDLYLSRELAKRKFNYCPERNIYNILWADGKSSYCHPEIPEDGFIVNQLQSGKFSLKPNLYGRKFLYRGQSKFYDDCTPSLFRDKKQNYFLKELIQYDELRAVLQSHPLVRLFEPGIDLWHDIFRFEVNYGGLAQHYYNKTPYLDLTSDIDAAKFFAVTDYFDKEDEYRPHISTGELGVLYFYEISEPGAFLPYREQHLSTIGKQVFMRSGMQHGFLLNMDKGSNFNSFPQVHKVFFRHNDELAQKIFKESGNGSKYFPADILQIQWKRFTKEFKCNPAVSLDAVKINVQDNIQHHETVQSIIRKLNKNYNITVDKDRTPCFDEDLLDKYYEDIRNGWWQDVFCKDIYFVGSDGIVYKDMLMKAPSCSRYKAFFYR